jgi:pimeloyl-ACP methyl ester carboxylesterase
MAALQILETFRSVLFRRCLLVALLASSCGEDADAGDGDTDGGDTDGDSTAIWVEHPCTMTIPNGLAASDLTCGTLTAPQNWDATEDDATVSIEVAVLHAVQAPAEPDPFVFFGGGPGAWNLEGYLPAQAVGALGPIRERRDIVFFDKRGNGLSTPSLFCPEYDTASLASYQVDQSGAEDGADQLGAYQQCKARLDAEGVDVSHFDSYQVGFDVVALMEALGYDTYNLYGISYGTYEAQVVMRDHPEDVRSVVLDGVVPLQSSWAGSWPGAFAYSLSVLEQECAEAEQCSQSFPDLHATTLEAINRLNETPHVSSVPGADGSPIDIYITGDRFAVGLHSALYRKDLIPLIPAAIGDAASGSGALLDAFAPALVSTGGFDWGRYAAVVCAEQIPFETPASAQAESAAIDPVLAGPINDVNASIFFDMCDAWTVATLPETANQPVVSDIPTLLMTGQFDPATPPAEAELAAQNFSRGTAVVFNGIGHGVLRSETAPPGELTCSQQMVIAFLDDPEAPVDTACAAALPDVVQ